MNDDHDEHNGGPDTPNEGSPGTGGPGESTPRPKGENRIEPGGEGAYELAPPDVLFDAPKGAAAHKPGKAKINAPGLTDDFDEDADFSKDPEVERALSGEPATDRGTTKDEDAAEKSDHPFVRPAQKLALPAKFTAGIGAGLIIAGAIAAAVRSEQWLGALLVTLYWGVLHTATGVGAVGIAAHFNHQKFGRLDLAAARMSVCVGIVLLLVNLNIPIPTRFDEALLSAVGYFGCALILFANGLQKTLHLAAAHFALWGMLYLGALLHAWAAGAAQA